MPFLVSQTTEEKSLWKGGLSFRACLTFSPKTPFFVVLFFGLPCMGVGVPFQFFFPFFSVQSQNRAPESDTLFLEYTFNCSLA